MRSGLIQALAILPLVFGSVGVETLAHETELKPVQRREVQIPIKDFTLVDQNSREFKFSQLASRVVVVAFAYTTCPDVCPLITAALRQVQSGLTAEERRKVFLLTITTDPEIDSPKILADYSKRYGAELATWSFLTGDPTALQKVWKNFGVGVKRKGRGLVDHTPLTAVIDRQGKMRVAYVGPAPEAKAVLLDVRRFLVR